MQWVAKRSFALIAGSAVVLLLSALVTLTLFTDSISLEPQVKPVTTCFDPISATLRVTTEDQCPKPLINLGNAPLSESATAGSVVTELHPLLLARFNAAKSAAEREGVSLYISSGFRTLERQRELFEAAIEKYGSESEAARWALPSQVSHHPDGLAIDVNYPGAPDGARWLEENGYRYGLCRVYANEWWHFEGVIAPGQNCPAMASDARVDLG